MTSEIEESSFDKETKAFLIALRDRIEADIPLGRLPHDLRQLARQKIEGAILALARAGQRDREALERYARAQVSPLIAAAIGASGTRQ